MAKRAFGVLLGVLLWPFVISPLLAGDLTGGHAQAVPSDPPPYEARTEEPREVHAPTTRELEKGVTVHWLRDFPCIVVVTEMGGMAGGKTSSAACF
jgi:hypothetical protein